MNDLERFKAVCRGEQADFVPIIGLPGASGLSFGGAWGEVYDRLIETGMPSWVKGWNSKTQWHEDAAESWSRFWGTLTPLTVDFWPGEPAKGIKYDTRREGDFEIIEYETGAMTKQLVDAENSYAMPGFMKYHVTDRQSWEVYKQLQTPGKPWSPQKLDEACRRFDNRDRPAFVSVLSTWGFIRDIAGTELASIMLYEDPALAEEIVEWQSSLRREYLFPLIERLKPEIVKIGEDCCYNKGMLISPKHFDSLCAPAYREIAEVAKDSGVELFVIDTDGNVEQLLPLLRKYGVNGVYPVEAKANPDLVKLRKHNPDFVIIGGLEKEVINEGNEDLIEPEINGKVPPMLKSGRYLPNIDHSLQPMCTFANLCRFLDMLHKATGNPLGEFRKYLLCIIVFLHILLPSFSIQAAQARDVYIPYIEGDWWQVAGNPDLNKFSDPKQQPVDFAVWQAEDRSWQLWSCIRNTKTSGHTRLFYRWEGKTLTDSNWMPMGISMMSEKKFGEPPNGLQAPHVVKWKDTYWMAYGDWENICLATSKDGKDFKRLLQPDRRAAVFTEGPEINTRDAMLLFTKGKWHCYYTAFPVGHGYDFCRTSDDLIHWSDSVVVAYGGRAGNNPFSGECPHVVEFKPGCYFLFRTQLYGLGAQTSVYCSDNPMDFGIDDDRYFVRQLKVAAPEIIHHNGQYYIAALNLKLDGIRIAKLEFRKFDKPLFDFNDPNCRKEWKKVSGKIPSVFVKSRRLPFSSLNEFFIGTSETNPWDFDEKYKVTIEGPKFKMPPRDMVVMVSGGDDREKTYIGIIDAENEKELYRITGFRDNVFRPVYINTATVAGREVFIRIVDESDQWWGHINFEGILLPET